MEKFRIEAWGRNRLILLLDAVRNDSRSGVAAIMVVLGLIGSARAQSQAPAADPGAASNSESAQEGEPARGTTAPLSLRYKFIEQYSPVVDPAHPELLTEYEVGTREKYKFVRDVPQGAPIRNETTLQTIYTERVSKLSPSKTALEVVRRYDRTRFSTTLPLPKLQNPGPLEQLTLFYQLPAGKPVKIFNLSGAGGRRFRQVEYDEILRNPFLPRLAAYLPTTPRRVGDVWQVPPSMTALLLSEPLANDPNYSVEAELIEVRDPTAGSPDSTAVIGLKGRVVAGEDSDQGPVAFNARVHFTFQPISPPQPAQAVDASARKRPGAPIEARGYISQVRLAESRSIPLGDEEERLKQTVDRELVLARRLLPSDRAGLPLTAPDAIADDPALSWITYDDPDHAFHVEHPQDLRFLHALQGSQVDFIGERSNGLDLVAMSFPRKTGDPAKDRLVADPLEQKKNFMDKWKEQEHNVLLGSADWLKDPELDQLKRKVYRIEAALKPNHPGVAGGKDQRIYIDYYIVQLPRDETLIVEATTEQAPHVEFRTQVETMIKRFNLGPSEGPAPARNGDPAANPEAAAPPR